jgi:hypothetical protein
MAKTYVRGSAKKFEFKNGGSVLNISLNVDNLQEHADEQGWVRLVISERSEPDMYKNTHSMYVNEWKPDQAKTEETSSAPQKGEDEEKLPF